MGLRGNMDVGRKLLRRLAERAVRSCLMRRVPCAPTSCPLRVLRGETFVTIKNSKLHESMRFSPLSRPVETQLQMRNLVAHPGISGLACPSVCCLPVTRESFPCYPRIISLLSAVPRAPETIAQHIVIQVVFPANRSENRLFSLCYLGVIREYQGESGAKHSPSRPLTSGNGRRGARYHPLSSSRRLSA